MQSIYYIGGNVLSYVPSTAILILLSPVVVPIIVTLTAFVWMFVTPIPVSRPFPLVCLPVFMLPPVVL